MHDFAEQCPDKRACVPMPGDRFARFSFDELDFRAQATLGLTGIALLVITPFLVSHALNGRYSMVVSDVLLLGVLCGNSLAVLRHGRSSRLLRLAMVPLALATLVLATRMEGVIGLLWTYPAVLLFYSLLEEREAWIATGLLLAVMVPALGMTLPPELALRGVATLILVGLFAAVMVRVIASQHRRLTTEVMTDPLTGLMNRRALGETLDDSIAFARKTQVSMALLELDLDHFKRINDRFGHAAGDDVLREVGAMLSSNLRAGDLAYRLGGEEFLVLLHGVHHDDAFRLADALRTGLSERPALVGCRVTASIGLAMLEAHDVDWQSWFERADRALYKAKAGGRDRLVSHYGDSVSVAANTDDAATPANQPSSAAESSGRASNRSATSP